MGVLLVWVGVVFVGAVVACMILLYLLVRWAESIEDAEPGVSLDLLDGVNE